jgi:hypothetical protein
MMYDINLALLLWSKVKKIPKLVIHVYGMPGAESVNCAEVGVAYSDEGQSLSAQVVFRNAEVSG